MNIYDQFGSVRFNQFLKSFLKIQTVTDSMDKKNRTDPTQSKPSGFVWVEIRFELDICTSIHISLNKVAFSECEGLVLRSQICFVLNYFGCIELCMLLLCSQAFLRMPRLIPCNVPNLDFN